MATEKEEDTKATGRKTGKPGGMKRAVKAGAVLAAVGLAALAIKKMRGSKRKGARKSSKAKSASARTLSKVKRKVKAGARAVTGSTAKRSTRAKAR